MRTRIIAAFALLGLSIGAQPLAADEYPSRPVRVVIPFAAGAGTDLTGRVVAQELSKRLGQQFFVENRPGAAAQLGTDMVAKAQPDGYTVLWTVTDGLSVLPAVKTVPYAVPDDFAFIGSLAQQPYALAVNPKWPFKTTADLVAYAKANPDKLNFGSAGVASAPHLTMALFGTTAGVRMVHVPFAGLGPATNALIAGTVDVGLVTPVQLKPHLDAGALRALAVTGPSRSRVLPDVPTLREAGLNVTAIVAYGLTAPVRIPEPVRARLTQAMTELTSDRALADQLRGIGLDVDPLIGNAYRDFIVRDLEQWRAVGKAANIRIEN